MTGWRAPVAEGTLLGTPQRVAWPSDAEGDGLLRRAGDAALFMGEDGHAGRAQADLRRSVAL